MYLFFSSTLNKTYFLSYIYPPKAANLSQTFSRVKSKWRVVFVWIICEELIYRFINKHAKAISHIFTDDYIGILH